MPAALHVSGDNLADEVGCRRRRGVGRGIHPSIISNPESQLPDSFASGGCGNGCGAGFRVRMREVGCGRALDADGEAGSANVADSRTGLGVEAPIRR
jgi:hypothetical protein